MHVREWLETHAIKGSDVIASPGWHAVLNLLNEHALPAEKALDAYRSAFNLTAHANRRRALSLPESALRQMDKVHRANEEYRMRLIFPAAGKEFFEALYAIEPTAVPPTIQYTDLAMHTNFESPP